MRDVVTLVAVLFFVSLSLRSTFVAYLLWGWCGLISLNAYMYGFMAGIQMVQLFALICLGRLLVDQDLRKNRYEPNRTTLVLAIFAIHMTLCALLAYPNLPRNWEAWGNMMKTLLYCAIMPMVVRDRRQIYSMVVMMVLGICFHGMLDGLKFISSGGSHKAAGVKFGDNNYYAMVLASAIPLLYYLARHLERRLLQLGAYGVMTLMVMAVIATKSRGGLLCLLAIGFWIVLASSRKFLGMMVLAAAAGLVVVTAPASWFERMNTMKTADEDGSFMGRVAAWRKSTAIALENPVFGGGIFAVQAPTLVEKFRNAPGLMGWVDAPDSGALAAHSIYFQVMGDQGFVGFLIFVGMLLNGFVTRREIVSRLKRVRQRNHWAADLADMLAASILAFSVGGALLSAAYLEVPYLSLMLLETIKIYVRKELEQAAKDAAPAGPLSPVQGTGELARVA